MDANWFFVFMLGALVGWVLEWVYDTFLWRRERPRDAVTNDDLRATLALRERELLELRARVEHGGGHS
jgi:hypothetical protein